MTRAGFNDHLKGWYIVMNKAISSNPLAEFQQAIFEAGLGSPNITCDGEIHRFHIEGDKQQTLNGWYFFDDDHGAFGNWKTDFKQTFCQSSSKPLSLEDYRKQQATIQKAKLERQQATRIKHENASIIAQKIWDSSKPVQFHNYLKTKKVLPHGIRENNDFLIIPLFDSTGKIWSYQRIDSVGNKRFLKGGKISGNFYKIGKITNKVYIAEGFATGASLHQELKTPVIIAFNCQNLKSVALAVRAKYPDVEIVIAADNDVKTAGNPGLSCGREAAKGVDGSVIYPVFLDENFEGNDFNDLYRQGGGS